jgi:protease-4
VREARDLSAEEAAALADGRVFSGRQAFQEGLVDTLGDLSLALDLARDRARLPETAPVIEHRSIRLRWWELLLQTKLPWSSWGGSSPRLEYRLFLPGGAGVVPPRTR